MVRDWPLLQFKGCQNMSHDLFDFSIIIPSYNRPERLMKALMSVLSQDYTSYEIIVVNDGSTNSYVEIYTLFGDRVTFLENVESLGVAAARNLGASHASGAWLAFLDDDDEYLPGYLPTMAALLSKQSSQVGLSWCSIQHFVEEENGQSSHSEYQCFDANSSESLPTFCKLLFVGCGFGLVVRRSVFLALNGFDDSFTVGEDTEFILNFLSTGGKAVAMSQPGVRVYHHIQDRLSVGNNIRVEEKICQRLIHRHSEIINRNSQSWMLFVGWSVSVQFRGGTYFAGLKLLGLLLKRRPLSLRVWGRAITLLSQSCVDVLINAFNKKGEEEHSPSVSLSKTMGEDEIEFWQRKKNPPSGLLCNEVPQFVILSFDDNYTVGSVDDGGVLWANHMLQKYHNPMGEEQAETFDGENIKVTFFNNTIHTEEGKPAREALLAAWQESRELGHELANHTHEHKNGAKFTTEQWNKTIVRCNDYLLEVKGVHAVISENQRGFRAPYLNHNDSLYRALDEVGFCYDSSIQEGYQPDQDGGNNYWPYRMTYSAPGPNLDMVEHRQDGKSSHSKIWQLPVYALTIPSDQDMVALGLAYSLRGKMYFQKPTGVDAVTGKFTGLDYNLFFEFSLIKEEIMVILKHSFQLKLKGNRSPFMLGLHSDFYSSACQLSCNLSAHERRQLIEEFITYCLTFPEVRLVNCAQLLKWLECPVPLNNLATS